MEFLSGLKSGVRQKVQCGKARETTNYLSLIWSFFSLLRHEKRYSDTMKPN